MSTGQILRTATVRRHLIYIQNFTHAASLSRLSPTATLNSLRVLNTISLLFSFNRKNFNTVTDLARLLGIKRTTVNSIVNEYLEAGSLTELSSPEVGVSHLREDGRKTYYSYTTDAKRRTAKFFNALHHKDQEVAGWSEEQFEAYCPFGLPPNAPHT